MKKTLIIATMLFASIAIASPSSQLELNIEKSQDLLQEKVKIDPDSLPDPVKIAISRDETINTLPVEEAWKITLPEDQFHYAVSFDNGTEEKLTKKYDAQGNEIIE